MGTWNHDPNVRKVSDYLGNKYNNPTGNANDAYDTREYIVPPAWNLRWLLEQTLASPQWTLNC